MWRGKLMEAEVLTLAAALIAEQSVSGPEAGAARVLTEYSQRNGLSASIDRYGSAICVADGDRPGKTLLFDGHIDTVPVADEGAWTYPPFQMTVENGRVYGRGAADMKCAVAAMAAAVVSYAKRTNGHFPGRLALCGVVHEECFEGVASRAIADTLRPDFVIIGEASEENLKLGQRGRAELVFETFGTPAHSASPEKGVNAVYAMLRLIERLRGLPVETHPVLGRAILELTDIVSRPYPGASVVPAYCRATFDRRLLSGETREGVLAPYRALIDALHGEDASFSAAVGFAMDSQPCYTGEMIAGERFFPAWLMDAQTPYLARIRERFARRSLAPALDVYQFCTNGSCYAGERDIPTLGYGPSCETDAHTVDESCPLDALLRAVQGYTDIIEAWMEEA